MTDQPPLALSTVTPVYSGERFLADLVSELCALRKRWLQQEVPVCLSESIFVVDAAIDDSASVLKKLAAEHAWIRVITLSRNYGTHSATAAGIVASTGDWIATLDEDLQHRPAQIEPMLKLAVTRSADIVYAEPQNAVHGGTWRDLGSKSVKKVLARLASTPQIQQFNSFRILRGDLARNAASVCTNQTYFDMALSWFSNNIATLPMTLTDQRYIEQGQSGFTLGKLASHARKLLISSRSSIASRGLYLGAFTTTLAALAGVMVIVQHLFFPDVIRSDGWASLMVVISFFSGVIVMLLCLALEYLDILMQQQMGHPNFFVISRESDLALQDWAAQSGSLDQSG